MVQTPVRKNLAKILRYMRNNSRIDDSRNYLERLDGEDFKEVRALVYGGRRPRLEITVEVDKHNSKTYIDERINGRLDSFRYEYREKDLETTIKFENKKAEPYQREYENLVESIQKAMQG